MRPDANPSDASGEGPAGTDVLVIGAGIAGSLLALVLGRRKVGVTVVDLHPDYPPDFRCEKLSAAQVEIFRELDVLPCLQAICPGEDIGSGQPLTQYGFRYETLVNAVRAAWPGSVRFVAGRSSELALDAQRQRLTLLGGQSLEGRLAVLATGPSPKLAASLGIGRRKLRERHSVCIGFSIAVAPGSPLFAEGLVHQGERTGDHIGYASFFPVADLVRVNIFAFHDPRDDWVQGFRADPLAQLVGAMPRLRSVLGGATLVGAAQIRATDLYEAEDYLHPGLVLIGDAYRSSCPATGSGVLRALTDVRQLACVHLPAWLEAPQIGVEAISRFYSDPVKQAMDARSARQSEMVRAMATETSLAWRARRAALRVRQAAARSRQLAARARQPEAAAGSGARRALNG